MYHPGITSLFKPIPGITKLSVFQLLADDGHVHLGAPTSPPEEKYPGATSSAVYYPVHVVEKQKELLNRRSIAAWIAAGTLEGAPRGVGSGSGSSLLPLHVTSVRPVLLFVRPSEADKLYLMVPGYSKFKNDADGIALVSEMLSGD